MEIKLGVAIMHLPIPERRHFLQDIQRRLDSSEAAFVDVVLDPLRKGIWPTAKIAWKHAGFKGATHHLVISDDALVCRDFIAGLKNAIAARPEHAVTPYSGYKLVAEAQARGDSWCTVTGGAWGLAAVFPVPMVDEFLRWEAATWRQDAEAKEKTKHWDDCRVAAFLIETNREAWVTVPTLAEHAGVKASTVGHNGGGNLISRSRAFLGADRSALEIDWTVPDKPLRGLRPLGDLKGFYRPLSRTHSA